MAKIEGGIVLLGNHPLSQSQISTLDVKWYTHNLGPH